MLTRTAQAGESVEGHSVSLKTGGALKAALVGSSAVIGQLLAYFLGTLLLLSIPTKLIWPDETLRAITVFFGQAGLSGQDSAFVVYAVFSLLIAAEFWIGFLLLGGFARKVVSVAAALLFAGFIVVLIFNAMSGEQVGCGCGFSRSDRIGAWDFARTGGLLVAAVVLFISSLAQTVSVSDYHKALKGA